MEPFPPTSVNRREDRRFVTGTGRYVADLATPDTVHLAFVRSTEAHARIVSADLEAARQAPGVVGVYTGADLGLPDIPGDSIAVSSPDFPRPHLPDRARHVGEALVVVAAETERAAVDAADLVWLEYEPLPVVADPHQAADSAQLIHEGAGTNVVERFELGDPFEPRHHEVSVEIGVRNQRLAPTSVEALAILAEPQADGRLLVHCGHQRAHELRNRLAGMLDLDQESVRVIIPDVGGGFGMKGMTYPEYTVTAAVALRLGRPAMWAERRREHLAAGTHGRGSFHTIRLSGRADGRIERAEIDALFDTGAYPHNGSAYPTFSRYLSTGLYDFPEVRITTTTVVTNRAPTGSYRGAGRPEASYAIERAIDAYAAAAQLDPAEVRLANFISSLPFRTPTGALYDSGDYAAALRKVVGMADLAGLRAEQERRRTAGRNPLGVGIGAFVERAGGRVDTGEMGRVEVDGDGRVTVWTGSVSAGQAHETVWAQVAAQALGVDLDEVTVVAGDTDALARSSGTGASRSAQIGASAVWRVAHEVRAQASKVAADLLEVAVEDLVVADGSFSVAGVPGSAISWATVAAAAAEADVKLAAEEWYVPGAQTFPYGAYLAVVEVDLDTGEVKLCDLFTVDDCGRVLNPMVVMGQVEGSLAQGIGQALYEEIDYAEDGQLRTATLMDYALPRAGDIPPIHHGRTVSPAPSNVLGVKGSGEAGCIGGPPAIVNAALDALAPYGVTHLDMPLRPSTVWAALQAASK